MKRAPNSALVFPKRRPEPGDLPRLLPFAVPPDPVAVERPLPLPSQLVDLLARLVDDPGFQLDGHDVSVHLHLGNGLLFARVVSAASFGTRTGYLTGNFALQRT